MPLARMSTPRGSARTTSAGSPATPLAAGAYTIRGVLSGDGIENYSYGVQVVP
jgi:hypothetical protein